MDACLSVIKVLISRPHPRRYAMQFLKPRNSIAGLLPATFLYKIEECVSQVFSR